MPTQHIDVAFVVPPHVALPDLTGPAYLFEQAQALGTPLRLHYLSTEPLPHATLPQGTSNGHRNACHRDACHRDACHRDACHRDACRSEAYPCYQSYAGQHFAYVLLPGPGGTTANQQANTPNPELLQWLKGQHQQGAQLCGLYSGTFLLGHAGLLNHVHCTTHWQFFALFKQLFPKARLFKERLFVQDKGLYTCAGQNSSIDLALHLISTIAGPKVALQVARQAMVYWRQQHEAPPLPPLLRHRNHLQTTIHQVQDHINEMLGQAPVSLEALAAKAHMSSRNLSRRFKEHTGITIGQYLQELRVEKALDMLQAGTKVNAVAQKIGLKSETQLRRIIVQQLGTLPKDLKKVRHSE